MSLLVHAVLLSLGSGGDEHGLAGFDFPWRDRRTEVPELRLVLAPAPAMAAAPAALPAPGPVLRAEPTPEAVPPRKVAAVEANDVADVHAPLRADRLGGAVPAPNPGLAAMISERAEPGTWTVPTAPSVPMPIIAAAPTASSPEFSDAAQVLAARQEVERQEAARLATARQLAAQQMAAQQAEQRAAQQAAAQQAVMQQAALQQVAAQQELARLERARMEGARLEAERQETARQTAAQQAAALQEAARQDAARLEAERLDATRQAAARADAARLQALQDDERRRDASRRAMGRQLDEEAAQRQASAAAAAAARPAGTLPLSWSSARRGRLFGRTDANVELVLYAEAWARKIELNMTFEMVREAARRPHTDPVVTVAVRSDGSVESLSFVVASGVAEIDEAIRRVVQSQLPYPAFPPALAREFDVVEIRRTWHLDTAIRLY